MEQAEQQQQQEEVQLNDEAAVGESSKRKLGSHVEVSPIGSWKNGILSVVQSPWYRLAMYMLACLLTSGIYYGWQHYAEIIYKDDAYGWLCSMDEEKPCEAQKHSVETISIVASSCEYASAATGGMLLDHLGPRKTAILGEFLWFLGFILFCFSSQSAQMYIPAHILIGSSVNIVCFPSLSVVETFPAWHALMVGLILGAQNLGTIVPTPLLHLMRKHNYTLRNTWGFYLLFVGVPVALLYITALPSKRDFQSLLNEQLKELKATENKNALKANHQTDALDQPNQSIRSESDLELATANQTIPVNKHRLEEKKASWRDFFRNIRTPEMVLFGVYFCLMQHMYAYNPLVVKDAISPRISDYFAYFLPTQAAWSIAVGFLCQYVPTLAVMLGMCITFEFVLVMSLFPKVTALQYFSATLLIITQCAVFEVKYTFVAELFDPYNYGKLVGLNGLIGGIGTTLCLATIYIRPYWKVYTIYLCLTPIAAGIVLVLIWRRSKGISYKTRPVYEQLKDQVAAADQK